MRTAPLTVLKVGGSLLEWPAIPRRLTEFINARQSANPQERIVLIAGGGPAADFIRALDRIHGLGEQTSDRLALHAMDFTAAILNTLLPGTVAVQSLEMLDAVWLAGSIPVLSPRVILAEAERSGKNGLPASWEVTSDSIAAWIALQTGADRLILAKSVPLPAGATRQEAAHLGLVDPMFPIVAEPLAQDRILESPRELVPYATFAVTKAGHVPSPSHFG